MTVGLISPLNRLSLVGSRGSSTYAASCGSASVQGPEICFPKHASRDLSQQCRAQQSACCFLEISCEKRTNPKPLSSSLLISSLLLSSPLLHRFICLLFQKEVFFHRIMWPCGVWQNIFFHIFLGCWTFIFAIFFCTPMPKRWLRRSERTSSRSVHCIKERKSLAVFPFIFFHSCFSFHPTSRGCNDKIHLARLADWSLHVKDAEGNTAEWRSCHLPGAFGEKGRHEARVPEQKELGQHQMAHQVVRPAAKHALLFRERVELATLGIVPVGGLHLRQGAFAEALAVSQGVFGKTGMERARASTHTQRGGGGGGARAHFPRSGFQASRWNIDELQSCMEMCVCAAKTRLWTLF